jgi:hypothetical protein
MATVHARLSGAWTLDPDVGFAQAPGRQVAPSGMALNAAVVLGDLDLDSGLFQDMSEGTETCL